MSDFKGRRFPTDIILVCVRWYCRYGISYRDLEEMMAERGVVVDHTTLFRWVQRYAPFMEKRIRWYQRYTDASWRVGDHVAHSLATGRATASFSHSVIFLLCAIMPCPWSLKRASCILYHEGSA